jgi:hypothetical protein
MVSEQSHAVSRWLRWWSSSVAELGQEEDTVEYGKERFMLWKERLETECCTVKKEIYAEKKRRIQANELRVPHREIKNER